MPGVDVECPECGSILPMAEDQLGTQVKCPKCKFLFAAEKGGGAYELIEDEAPVRTRSLRESSRQQEAPPPPETEAERKLRERMEKWAADND